MSKKWYNLFISVDPAAEDAAGNESDRPEKRRQAGTPSAAQTIAEIAAAVSQSEPKFTGPIKNVTSFEEIYRAAQITTPAHGYSILKVADMLASEHIRALPRDVKRSSVLVALEAAGVALKEIVEDAVRRDRALDAFERVQQQDIEKLAASRIQENARLQAEIDRMVAEHRARIQANDEQVAKAKQQLEAWKQAKQREEARIADAIGHFVSDNPITHESGQAVDSRPAQPPPAKRPPST